MEILVTLPETATRFVRKHPEKFPVITACYSDPGPPGLGSAGGTVHLLHEHRKAFPGTSSGDLEAWLSETKRIVIHSGGQSRRLPAYSPQGKALMPFPVFKWGRGQHLGQTLLELQRPLLEKFMTQAPGNLTTMVASGDVLVMTGSPLPAIPEADVVCVGIWEPYETAARHGVFVCRGNDPTHLEYMLQKPSQEEVQALSTGNLYLLDAGIWLLSPKAVRKLFELTGWQENRQQFNGNLPAFLDLYAGFGQMMTHLHDLTVKILPVEHASFYHVGSNNDLLRSAAAIQNRIVDQREIWHKKIKLNPTLFILNARVDKQPGPGNHEVWIDNAFIPDGWTMHDHHIITGVPENNWSVNLPPGLCVDIVPVKGGRHCLRVYGFHDLFRGPVNHSGTTWMNEPAIHWFEKRGFDLNHLPGLLSADMADAPLFPVISLNDSTGDFLQWIVSGIPVVQGTGATFRQRWLRSERLSAATLAVNADLERIFRQARTFRTGALSSLAANHARSVFYQLDLLRVVSDFKEAGLDLPAELPETTPVMTRIHDQMFRAVFLKNRLPRQSALHEKEAFGLLRREILTDSRNRRVMPVMNMKPDSILWGRSPVRLDLAGGWTDTPPWCMIAGGTVVNLAVELNGQPPLQVFVRPVKKPEILLRSVDIGANTVVRRYEDLDVVDRVGSAFSIPKAVLMLSGFHPDYCSGRFTSLKDQLEAFGGGFEISVMVAVPKGSGLGTSSILAATLLGTLSELCSFGWDRYEIAHRTMVVEQLLTTGGGWQDQFGGLFEGVKRIESQPGLIQQPSVRWAPGHLFTDPACSDLMLLYYTGITRVAKNILREIVRGMFLNSAPHLAVLAEMKEHSEETYTALLEQDRERLAWAIGRSWQLNQRLDRGTNPPEVAAILQQIDQYMLAAKLLGAGGGGYLMIMARDAGAARTIRKILSESPPNAAARFVDWKLSDTGFRVSRS